ncbi:hypothetical protein C1926_10065 [Stenotrophomonas sp. ZAC14A_NAIMI4_1]|nr:hypothetical protein C1926_10065 [Stenotrophomonas sp. ZAC14A_NAIMI4_1]
MAEICWGDQRYSNVVFNALEPRASLDSIVLAYAAPATLIVPLTCQRISVIVILPVAEADRTAWTSCDLAAGQRNECLRRG